MFIWEKRKTTTFDPNFINTFDPNFIPVIESIERTCSASIRRS